MPATLPTPLRPHPAIRHTPLAALLLVALAALPLAAAAGELEAHSDDTGDMSRMSLPSASPAAKAGGPTDAQVGDVASFGRALRWLGVTDMTVVLGDCSGSGFERRGCQTLAPAPATTSFEFEDLARIELPPRASHSLLCHWFSPVLDVTYANPGAAPVVAQLSYNPSLTIENPVLATPGLVDPATGLPLAGRLTTSMTASERFQVPVPAGLSVSERSRDSAVCIAGFLNHKTLTQYYGLTEAQVAEFFRRPTTVRFNVSGTARHVQSASLYFGLRIIGD